ncbi:HpcH/HpaI aldolase family protein [Merismopedia glauca]|uniref:Aldolase n=1 Tax=Merismopedia glauca CCAP 1448/3 TaxID=1296344 RepID=A0A2T1C0B8_9CYAN|nr:aldolase/citrate lyase family protein [Merismopedia glauca]PSB01719.1 aldolase [Merismopedia glauca CCAP 1448/3]
MRENHLKTQLQAQEVVLGLFINSTDPALVEIGSYAGFDFVVIDLEHGALDISVAVNLCRAADGLGLAPLVRVAKNDPAQIQAALDIGSAGVLVPQVQTEAEAIAAVKAAKFNPLGTRGLSFATRAGMYGAAGTQITEEMNHKSLVIVQVEGTEGVDNIEAIARVPHLDGIFLGPYDLSQSLGIPGQVRDMQVISLMQQCVGVIRQSGKFVGTYADNPEIAKEWINLGVQLVAVGVDVVVFLKACQSLVAQIDN